MARKRTKKAKVAIEDLPGTADRSAATAKGGSSPAGAPVDPRYGQSNEVGQLADYGYDCARDVSR
jgi:hypothetical protein